MIQKPISLLASSALEPLVYFPVIIPHLGPPQPIRETPIKFYFKRAIFEVPTPFFPGHSLINMQIYQLLHKDQLCIPRSMEEAAL